MNISVLVEPSEGNGYRARTGEPLSLTAEAPTREAALAELRGLIGQRLTNGSEILSLEVGAPPYARFAGWLKNDPLFDEWQQAIAENRQREDEAEGIR
jgi:hypothetical protein